MLYLLIVADSFDQSVEEELRRKCRYKVIDRTHNAMVIEAKKGLETLLKDAVFTYSCFPLIAKAGIKSDYHRFLLGQIRKLKIKKSAALRLEVYNMNCKQEESAKDLEVAVGTALEKAGYNINLSNPGFFAYCVLLNKVCYSGCINLGDSSAPFIDPFRKYQHKEVSRAEFKIVEAFDYFRITPAEVAIDIGAAPGGWSLFMAKKGSAVISVDNGNLDSAAIKGSGVAIGMKKSIKGRPAPRSIVHLKCGALEALKLIEGVKAGMLVDDINTGGIASAKLVMRYARLLERHAVLLMTVKCVHRKVSKYMGEVEGILKPSFRIRGWKVLPHNRQEITLFAEKV